MIFTRYFDLHCDTPYECYVKKCDFSDKTLAVNIGDMSHFECCKQIFAIWIKDDAENPYRLYKNILCNFKTQLQNAPGNLTPYFSVEGGAVLEDDTDRLYELKKDGITALTLTWNGKNRIASGAHAAGGITDFGRRVIDVMNKLGVLCDLSHINAEGFFEAVQIASRPIVTHACCDMINQNPRNLTDLQIRLVAERGGLIGLCLYPVFLGGEDVFESVYRHIYHLLDLGLGDNISIGSDFDGADMKKELSGISKIPDLNRYLSARGLEKSTLDKIFYKNADNFFANL